MLQKVLKKEAFSRSLERIIQCHIPSGNTTDMVDQYKRVQRGSLRSVPPSVYSSLVKVTAVLVQYELFLSFLAFGRRFLTWMMSRKPLM